MKASILGIGTELVDGQIVNKNASWISAKLKEFGLQTSVHLVVPDERVLMKDAITYCQKHSELIFVTGGLGPTSDDFTRDVVAEWAGEKLKFDEGSWQHVNERLTSRGYTVKEIQRQQCYFPESSNVLHNPEGTANGFYIKAHGKDTFVLPGPPREIEAIWNLSIQPWLSKKTEHLNPHITRKWDTLGVGESDIAMIVEEVLKGIDVEKGYRVHLPYVEVKLSFVRSREQELSESIQRLTDALSFALITRDGEDVAQNFIKSLSFTNSLSIVDEVTGQFLVNRIMPGLRRFMTDREWSLTSSRKNKSLAEAELQLLPIDEHSCLASIRHRGQTRSDIITSPYNSLNMRERRLQYFAEMALIFWSKNL